jgi:hypothetical protein
MRLCVECKYSAPGDRAEYFCGNPTLSTSPVTGEAYGRTCKELRDRDGRCGPEGRYWEGRGQAIPEMPPAPATV